jgi:hypothetical protein
LDRVDPEVIKPSKGLGSGPETDVSFHKGDDGGEVDDGVAGKMVGLKFIEVEEAPEEIRRRQAKATLEMGGENHHFPRIHHGL